MGGGGFFHSAVLIELDVPVWRNSWIMELVSEAEASWLA